MIPSVPAWVSERIAEGCAAAAEERSKTKDIFDEVLRHLDCGTATGVVDVTLSSSGTKKKLRTNTSSVNATLDYLGKQFEADVGCFRDLSRGYKPSIHETDGGGEFIVTGVGPDQWGGFDDIRMNIGAETSLVKFHSNSKYSSSSSILYTKPYRAKRLM